jgi:hypothetical protein
MKIYVLSGLLIIVLGFSACLKNEDNTAEGPKAQVAVINASFNTPAFDLTIDKNKVTTIPIAFGAVSGSAGNIYLPVQAGLRQMIMTSSTTTLLDKNFAFEANKYYSFFVYDTMKNSTANISIIIDDTTTIDTLGKARFFHLIPGNDQLSALLIKAKDTTALASSVAYPSGTGTFPTNLKPGSYRLELKLNGSVIYKDTAVVINARSLYTFIAKGTSAATGANAPSVMILQNK